MLARYDSSQTTLFYSNMLGAAVMLPILPFVWTPPRSVLDGVLHGLFARAELAALAVPCLLPPTRHADADRRDRENPILAVPTASEAALHAQPRQPVEDERSVEAHVIHPSALAQADLHGPLELDHENPVKRLVTSIWP